MTYALLQFIYEHRGNYDQLLEQYMYLNQETTKLLAQFNKHNENEKPLFFNFKAKLFQDRFQL